MSTVVVEKDLEIPREHQEAVSSWISILKDLPIIYNMPLSSDKERDTWELLATDLENQYNFGNIDTLEDLRYNLYFDYVNFTIIFQDLGEFAVLTDLMYKMSNELQRMDKLWPTIKIERIQEPRPLNSTSFLGNDYDHFQGTFPESQNCTPPNKKIRITIKLAPEQPPVFSKSTERCHYDDIIFPSLN